MYAITLIVSLALCLAGLAIFVIKEQKPSAYVLTITGFMMMFLSVAFH
jgi:hypothetical protein